MPEKKIVGCRRKNKAELVIHVEHYLKGNIHKKKPRKKSLSKIQKHIMEDIYYNSAQSLDDLREPVQFNQRKTSKAVIEKHLKELEKLDILTEQYRYYDPIERRYKRRSEKYYELTDKGHEMVSNFPLVVAEFRRKEKEYEKDARRY